MKIFKKNAHPSPLGVTAIGKGANVAVWSAHAAAITICVFDPVTDVEIFRDVLPCRKDAVHFGFVDGLKPGMTYGLRATGPWQPERGLVFDEAKLLLDPYATVLNSAYYYDARLGREGVDSAALVPKALVAEAMPDVPLRRVQEPQFIYELQVKSFTTLHPDIPAVQRGTVSALAHPAVLKHFKTIGIDTVELMPITAWIDERHLPPLGLRNAWGYNPVSFFASDPRLAPGGLIEIRDTVAKLHDAGLNVILDLVFNHTGESDAHGPTLSLRGLDQPSYYRMFDGQLANDAGCGNTLALDHPHTVRLVIDCLRHWVLKCGIDGFRFDLAPIMGRRNDGFHASAPLLQAIEADPNLSTRIMIAEPWDVGLGGYQIGNFPPRWYEWNDKFRDDVRRFWRGDDYSANGLATRLSGSSDVFEKKGGISRSVNFLAAHDGFTLHDLTKFTVKNNYANGEENRDGKNGEATCVGRDVHELLATLLLSRGVVMLTAGDEFGRTQNGNNNAYAQDNEVTWLDWQKADHELIAFVGKFSALRKKLALLTDPEFLPAQPKPDQPHAFWFDENGHPLDWSNPRTRYVGLSVIQGLERQVIVINGDDQNAQFPFVAHVGKTWRRIFSTKPETECPASSVSVFIEVVAD